MCSSDLHLRVACRGGPGRGQHDEDEDERARHRRPPPPWHSRHDAGAYVYFSFLRPFAEVAGVADDLDWTVPRDSLDLYPFLSLIDGTPEGPEIVDPGEYYVPIP